MAAAPLLWWSWNYPWIRTNPLHAKIVLDASIRNSQHFHNPPSRSMKVFLCLIHNIHMGMDQYLLIPFLMGWTSIYQLFWCSPGVQGFDTLAHHVWFIPHYVSLSRQVAPAVRSRRLQRCWAVSIWSTVIRNLSVKMWRKKMKICCRWLTSDALAV